MKAVNILGVPIAVVNIPNAVAKIEEWIHNRAKVYVTVTGVHGIMESQYDEALRCIHQAAGMCVPDGTPTVWIGKMYGHKNMTQVCGSDLMLEMMKASVEKGYTHFFFGGKERVAELLRKRLIDKYPGLKIMGTLSPPFRPMDKKEEEEFGILIEKLNPDILWVGLSTPKQEKWMSEHIGKINTRVMIGVGAAFDFHAGLVRRAPRWVQRSGLEWLFRLCLEPRRLWRRYLKNNPKFIWMMILQLLGLRKIRINSIQKESGY